MIHSEVKRSLTPQRSCVLLECECRNLSWRGGTDGTLRDQGYWESVRPREAQQQYQPVLRLAQVTHDVGSPHTTAIGCIDIINRML